MLPDIDPSQLTDSVLEDNYDARTLMRGRTYAAEGRASVLGSSNGVLRGVVAGSGRNTYLVEVELYVDPIGTEILDTCTCPVGERCKHAVALVLTHRLRAPAGPNRTPDWRRALSALHTEDDALPVELAPLALEVALSTPRSTRYAPEPATSVTLRPLRLGKRDRWIKTGATWRDITSGYDLAVRDVDPAHLSPLRALVSATNYQSYSVPAAIPIGHCDHDIWSHLRRAVDAGVVLVRERSVGPVVLAEEPARVEVDMVADEHGNVTMSTGFLLGDRSIDLVPGRAGMLGSPPHALFVTEGDTLKLIPLERTLHRGIERLASNPPLAVPAPDVNELLDQYPPILAPHAKVLSSDDSVSITLSEFDCLVAIIDRPAVDAADLSWGVRYRRGEHVTTYPIADPTRRGRDFNAERTAIAELVVPTHLLESLVDANGRLARPRFVGADAVRLLAEVVPWLVERGQVAVEVLGDSPELREATEDPLVSLSVTDPAEPAGTGESGAPDNDWFDLSVEISVDGEAIEFAHLFTALASGEELLVLPSGTWLRLDRPEFDHLRELIEEARGLIGGESSDGTIRISRFQSSWWDELAALGVVTSQSKRWADSVARLSGAAAPEPVDPPEGLTVTLRPYQHQGLDWLAFLHRHGLGGVLADDMGLGKTVQALALFLHVLGGSPDARFLVVAPTSVVENWHREATRFAPGVEVRTIHETHKRRGTSLAEACGDARIVVTSYALFRLEFDDYQTLDWEMLVLDEAQFVKNHKSKTYRCVRRLDATTKLAITGTPLENSLMDLWSLLSITAPGLYPDPKRFSEVYRAPIESGKAPELLETLRRRIAPLMRRRTKDEVLTELPPKIEATIEVDLSARHSRIYQTQLQAQRKKILGLVDDVDKNRFEILKSLTLLRQLSLDPGLVDSAHDGVGSAKLDQLVEDLTQVVAEGHRALVFSQFTRYLTRVKARLDDAGIGYSYLDGRTRKRDRAISAFKDGDVPAFVISLKAGGFGLNLTEADYCFVLDPWWNPAVETQAVDRTHRIGQRNQVMVYRYVSAGTIEEKVMELKERKAALFSSVMDADGALSGALTPEDIRGLFG